MAAIEGLTEEQCQALAGVKAGDLIMIENYPRNENDEGDENDDDENEGDGNEGDDNEGDDNEGDDGEDDESESADSENVDEDVELGQEGVVKVDGVGSQVNSDASQSANDVALSNGENETDLQSTTGASEDFAPPEGQHEAQNLHEQLHDEAVEDRDDVSVESEGNNQADGSGIFSTAEIYYVHALTKDVDGKITDVTLCLLVYSSQAEEVDFPTYRIFGTDVESRVGASRALEAEGTSSKSIKDAVTDVEGRKHDFYLNPTGDHIRNFVFHGRCPARCNRGWIATQEEMHAMVENDIVTVSPHSPVCPVCIGKNLMQEHQSLREMLEASHFVDIGFVVEFYGRLNPRRRLLGYGFKQFDEREWGYYFDDIPSENDEEVDGGHDGYEYWEEAMDPSNNAVLHPASTTTIAALPRKFFAEVSVNSGVVECHVCQEKFSDDVMVIELPCRHFFCEGGCVENWLMSYDTCPTCRKKVPAVAEVQEDTKINGTLTDLAATDNEVDIAEHVDGVANEEVAGGAEVDVNGLENDEDMPIADVGEGIVA